MLIAVLCRVTVSSAVRAARIRMAPFQMKEVLTFLFDQKRYTTQTIMSQLVARLLYRISMQSAGDTGGAIVIKDVDVCADKAQHIYMKKRKGRVQADSSRYLTVSSNLNLSVES